MRLNESLLVEIDGFEYHSSRESFLRDRRRDVLAGHAGWRSVRFAATQVLDEWDFVEAAVTHLLNSGDDPKIEPRAPLFRTFPAVMAESS